MSRWSDRLMLAVTIVSLCHAQAARADSPASQSAQPAEIRRHSLEVHLVPDKHELRAVDQMTITGVHDDVQEVAFTLNPSLHVSLVLEQGSAGSQSLPFSSTQKQAAEGKKAEQTVTVRFRRPLAAHEVMNLVWQYQGVIDEPPRESRQLRFVTPSETAGHIGNEGVYLSGETHWYPDIQGSLPTFRLRVTTPLDWHAVTHGKQTNRTVHEKTAVADWDVEAKTEALTLVANRFVITQRTWRDASGRAVELSTYLFPDDAHLADEYLDASRRYLETYTKLLGPYPFPKFAVVENFFASGLGMPSFTLLGSGIIKRHYVQPYALGHEIVHSWVGNWVFNDVQQGNWVEGLTTYLANYYYEELTGTPEQAREQRRMMLLGYAVYVRPEEDYPVIQFKQKTDQKDNAIGYQKAAMIFHMLRREIGEGAFWKGLRTVMTRYGGAYATWKDLETVFAETAGRDLRWFFTQWIERAGAPTLRIARQPATRIIKRLTRQGAAIKWFSLRVPLEQGEPPYRVRLNMAVKTGKGHTRMTVITMEPATQTVALRVPDRPISVHLDPNFESFHRIAREAVPPMLNLFVTDRNRSLVVPSGGTEAERQPYEELAKQVVSREQTMTQMGDQEASSAKGSMLVLGGPGINHAAEWAVSGCNGKVSLRKDSLMIEGTSYEGPDTAVLISCRHPDDPQRQVTLFYGVTPQAAAKVARLLFFYGWQSYLVFRDGTVIVRGDFLPSTNNMEVRLYAPKG